MPYSNSSHSGSLSLLLNPSSSGYLLCLTPTINTLYTSLFMSMPIHNEHNLSSLSPESWPTTGYSMSSVSSLMYKDHSSLHRVRHDYDSQLNSNHHQINSPTWPLSSKSSYHNSRSMSVQHHQWHSHTMSPYPSPYEHPDHHWPSSSPHPNDDHHGGITRVWSMIQLPTVDPYSFNPGHAESMYLAVSGGVGVTSSVESIDNLTIAFTFLSTILKHPATLHILEWSIPWAELAGFFATIPHNITLVQGVNKTGERERWAMLTSGGTPLPEDWCMCEMESVSHPVFKRGYNLLEEWRREVELINASDGGEVMDGIIEDGNEDEGATSKSMPKGETAKGGHRLWGGSVRMFGDVWSPVVWLSIIFDSLLHDVPIFCIPTLLYHFIPLLKKVHSLILINDEDYKLPHAQRSYQ